jgi:hypothetical protein
MSVEERNEEKEGLAHESWSSGERNILLDTQDQTAAEKA